jgi:hypothetical protein
MKKIKLFDIAARKTAAALQEQRKTFAKRLTESWVSDSDKERIRGRLAEIDANPDAALTAHDIDAVRSALDGVNGKATAHTYTTARELVAIADAIERKLEKHGVALKDRSGVKITATSGVPTAKAYNKQARSAIATRVTFERGGSAWYVVNVERVERYTGPGGDERIAVTLTDAAREAVIRNALEDFA